MPFVCDLSYFACERFRASICSIPSMSVSFHIGIYLFRFDSFPVWPDHISYFVMVRLDYHFIPGIWPPSWTRQCLCRQASAFKALVHRFPHAAGRICGVRYFNEYAGCACQQETGHLICIFYIGYCTAAYVSLYCLGVRYPSEYVGRSSLKNFIYASISSWISSPLR